MNHPGVKTLFERICKTNGLKQTVDLTSDKDTASLNDSLIIVGPSNEPSKHTNPSNNEKSTCKLMSFKEQLKQRMKEKRQLQRREEEEDARMDEEYHFDERKIETDVIENNVRVDNEADDELVDLDLNGGDGDAKEEGNDSDNDFKLNLNDDEDEEDDIGVGKIARKDKKKNIYDFDEDEDSGSSNEEESSTLTNTIPSNQLIKNPTRTQSFMNMEDLVGNSSGVGDTGGLANSKRLAANPMDDSTNTSFKDESKSESNVQEDEEEDGENDQVFDELAMLCSGQFKNTKKIDEAYLNQINKDLYSVDEGEDYDLSLRNKASLAQIDDNSSSSNSTDSSVKKSSKKREEAIDEKSPPETEIGSSASVSSHSSSASQSKKRKVEEVDLDNQDFFENEAALSGSEEDSDENYEGSDDDKSIVFSGDEDELPSDSELHAQLGKIYLKDQMDLDKQQLRLFKEMYLKDGELHEGDKHARRKQFRWKHLENENNNMFSSDDDEDNDEDEDDEDEEEQMDKTDDQKKSKKFSKSLGKRDWRSIRHEREQLVNAKQLKSNFLSDDENQENNENEKHRKKDFLNDEFSNSSTSQSKDLLGSSLPNQLMKKGQLLLKQKNNKQEEKTSVVVDSGKNLEDLKKKFSFLNRDQTYLKRLSSYVNKNIHGANSSSSANGVKRSNNMVFSSIDTNNEATTVAGADDQQSCNSKLNNYPRNKATSIKVIGQDAKRLKHDNCESIFNHIN